MNKRLVAIGVVILAGCAAALQANKKSPGKMENGEFKPERPAQEKYGPDPALACPAYGTNGALEEELNLRGGKRAQADGRLCAIADTMMGWKSGSDTEPVPESVRAFVSYYFGVPGQVRRMTINNIETEDPKNIATSAADAVANFAANASKPLYGLMTERVKKGNSRLALVFYDETVALDQPLPRKLAPNTSATLSGTLVGEYSKAKLEIVD